ncbi:MAG TPA: hypothetical protein VKA01_13295 [Vicinamibacteria bacterium]|nr:hypothetical protein [Vicinamibacteria bacterium]
MKLWRLAAVGAVLAALGMLAGVRPVEATMPIQKTAKAAGFADAGKCTYCHGEALPKKGASTMNDRGKWLVAEKDKRKAAEIDGAWLKDYKEPQK